MADTFLDREEDGVVLGENDDVLTNCQDRDGRKSITVGVVTNMTETGGRRDGEEERGRERGRGRQNQRE